MIDVETIMVSGIHVRRKRVTAPEVAHFGEPGYEAAKALIVELIESETVVCDLTQGTSTAAGSAGATPAARTSPRR